MASRRTVGRGSQIIFHGPRTASARSGGSIASNSTAHAVLARRLLFPHYPPSKPLPPLISLSNTHDPTEEGDKVHDTAALKALNDEIYDFLALAVRGFILPWWGKITPRDREFPQEVMRIVSHLIKELEARMLVADVPYLIANAIPTLVTQHYLDYRTAESKFFTSYATGLHPEQSDSLHYLFHSLQPHMAVSPEGEVDPNYVRQVIEHIMKACLPPEDWDAETERTIIREIVVKIVLEDAFPRLSQPWFLQKMALELLGSPAESAGPAAPISSTGWTLNVLVILFLSAVQAVSGFAIAAIAGIQACLHVVAEVNNSPHYAKGTSMKVDLVTPVIDLVSEVLNARESATMTAILSLLQLVCGFFAPFLNRLIPYLFYSRMHPSMFTKAVSQGKKVLFPNGYPEKGLCSFGLAPNEFVSIRLSVVTTVDGWGILASYFKAKTKSHDGIGMTTSGRGKTGFRRPSSQDT
ncbi:hypothetical protein FRC18_011381 [Serendipita sp. 400]|nr:hypothetical protein FRC18_011381 [Serendipita sp. 400]